jgi:hypothetical protein
MKMLFVIIIAMLFSLARAQEMPLLSEEDFPGITKITSKHFGNDALWGYINGGADLYLEYGFEHLSVQDVETEGPTFKVDIYRMSSPEAAYGIYSILRFRCKESGVIYETDCLTPYQYLAAKGDYYISVANTAGTLKDQELSLRVAQSVLNRIEMQRPEYPAFFDLEMISHGRNDLKLIHGPLGLQNGFANWEHLFTGFGNYELWVMPVELMDVNLNLGWIRFSTFDMVEKFLKQNGLETPDPAYLEPSKDTAMHVFLSDGALIIFEGPMPEAMYYRILDMYYKRD